MENPQDDLNAPSNLLDGAGNNAILVLRGRKKMNKQKGSDKPRKEKAKGGEVGMNKSKQRKLRRIQEEKERKVKQSNSLEILEKHRLRGNVQCLLMPSSTIGQVQTMRAKRLLAANFSKAGLEMPKDVWSTKRWRVGQDSAGETGEPGPNFSVLKTKPDPICLDELGVPDEKKSVEDYSTHGSKTYKDLPFDHMSSQDLSCDAFETVQIGNKVEIRQFSLALEQASHCFQGAGQEKRLQDKTWDGGCNAHPITTANASASAENSIRMPMIVHVSRPKEVEEQRSSLPIIMMEQEIMEAINENTAVIICGETGCGKTTQVPQFLYEAGYGSNTSPAKRGIIGITQPRRVAVLATAKRVSHELGLCLGKEVGFQVRHDKILGDKCSIKFMTDGILLRELQSDFLLKKYSVIILDEAHERSLNTDILIGMLSRIIRLRQKMYIEQQEKIVSGVKIKSESCIGQLKLVLMSATLRVEDFVSDRVLFQEPPPVIEVAARQFPVTIHFSKKTDLVDYVGQALKK